MPKLLVRHTEGETKNMSQLDLRKRLPHLGFLQIGIIVLTILTAVIHLYLGIHQFSLMAAAAGPRGSFSGVMSSTRLMLGVLFILNFVGYMVLVVALYLPALQHFQRLTRWLLIGFTALTILLWYLIARSYPVMMDYLDKSIEVALIALLLIEDWQTRRRPLNKDI